MGGGGAKLLSVGCGVDGTSIAGLPAALVGACVTIRDCGAGFEPAGQRDAEFALALSAGQRDVVSSADRCVFVVLSVGQRDVVSSADRRVFVVLSAGQRDVAFADGGITPSLPGPTSALSPCFPFDFG